MIKEVKFFNVRNITTSDIIQFKKDFEKLSVEQYIKFVMPLSKKDFGVLSNFMVHDFVYNFNSFLKTMNKFYRIYGGVE